MDGTSGYLNANVRFAIDGTTGTLRWTNSTSNTYDGATWDMSYQSHGCNILGSTTIASRPRTSTSRP